MAGGNVLRGGPREAAQRRGLLQLARHASGLRRLETSAEPAEKVGLSSFTTPITRSSDRYDISIVNGIINQLVAGGAPSCGDLGILPPK